MSPRRTVVLASSIALSLASLVAAAGPAGAGLETSEDQQIADDAVLTIDDVPSVFDMVPSTDDEPPPSGRACRAIRAGREALDEVPEAESDFETPGDESGRAGINNKVAVFETARGAKAVYRAYAGARSEACFTRTYEELFLTRISSPDAAVDVSVDRYQPDLGDQSVGYEIEIEVSAEDERETIYVEVVVVRVGRGFDGFAFFNTGSPPPSDDVVHMTETGVERLEAAL